MEARAMEAAEQAAAAGREHPGVPEDKAQFNFTELIGVDSQGQASSDSMSRMHKTRLSRKRDLRPKRSCFTASVHQCHIVLDKGSDDHESTTR